MKSLAVLESVSESEEQKKMNSLQIRRPNKILKKRQDLKTKETLYLVEWQQKSKEKGDFQNNQNSQSNMEQDENISDMVETWEPFRHLEQCTELIEKFEKGHSR